MPKTLLVLSAIMFASSALAATAVKVSFTSSTTSKTGSLLNQKRYFYVYRPDGLPTTDPLPAILVFEDAPASGASTILNDLADEKGIVIVSCSFDGNSTVSPTLPDPPPYPHGSNWTCDDPRWVGPEDYDYVSRVITLVKSQQNCNDIFICGMGQGGGMAYGFACERPTEIKAAACVSQFMEVLGNVPQAPVPMMVFQGTADPATPYAMARHSLEVWRTVNGLLDTAPSISFEPSIRLPSTVTQMTWRGGKNGTQAAWVSIVGGTDHYPTPTTETGYNFANGVWAFFNQYRTYVGADLRIVLQPRDNIQIAGQPATFSVQAAGDGPFTYRWQKNGLEIIGAYSSSYTTPITTTADNNGHYSVVVMSPSGTAVSTAATLTVVAAPAGPTITRQPANLTVAAGKPYTFSVQTSASGFPAYQWQRDGVNIAGAISSSYTYSRATPADSGATFRVLVTSATGTTTSARAVLTVTPAPSAPIIVTNPARLVVQINQTGPFTVNAWSRTPMTYQWQKAVSGTANFADIAGATSATYTPPSSTGELTLPHRCIVSNGFGSVATACELMQQSTLVRAPAFFHGFTSVGAQIGAPFTYTISQRGGTLPCTFAATPLPAGLKINATTGVISGVPTALGTTNVTVSASNTTGALTGKLVITVASTPPIIPIQAWRTAKYGASALNAAIAGDQSDPDDDHLCNLMEYALGTNPLNADLWSPNTVYSGGYLTQSAVKSLNATGIAWSAETSSDLRTWSGANTTILQNTSTLFQVRDNVRATNGTRRFMRLKTTLTSGGGL